MVQALWLVVAVLALFSVGYLGYSRYLAQFVELDDSRETPAHKYEDGQEYVPAKKPVLLGHHYSSIAGGAPIVGPITAGILWGWVPAIHRSAGTHPHRIPAVIGPTIGAPPAILE